MPTPKRPTTVTDIFDAIRKQPATVPDLAADEGLDEETLATRIDANLNDAVWQGTRFDDRTAHLGNRLGNELVTQVERSLMAQENYGEFESRMLKEMGVDEAKLAAEPTGWLRMADNQLAQETRLAWNEAMVSANSSADTVLAWEAVLDDATTKTCWDNHGKLQNEVSGEIPEHFGCRCQWRTLPSPDSADPEWAQLGQDILDEMAQEREQGSAMDDGKQEAERPQRVGRRLRESGHGESKIWERLQGTLDNC